MAFNNDNNNTSSATGAHKPTIGEKISGTVDSLVGKVTKNPAKVAEGEAKKSGDTIHGAAAGVGQATNGSSGLTDNTHSHTGTGLTGNNHSHTGTGLTGNNHSHTGTGLTGTHDHSHTGTGTGTGLTGSHHSGPGVGDRIAGEKDQIVGRATNNPAQYAQGEARAGEYGNTGTGYGASTGTGLTGSHHNTGTGLTGSHSTGTGLTGNHGHSHGTGLTGNHDSTVLGATGTHTGTGHSGLTGGNHGSGLTGNNYDNTSSGVGRNAGYEHGQPTAGDKISGGLDTLVGKVTSNPAKVAEGEAKRTGDPAHAQYAAANTGTDSYGNRQTGPGAGGFDGNPNTRI